MKAVLADIADEGARHGDGAVLDETDRARRLQRGTRLGIRTPEMRDASRVNVGARRRVADVRVARVGAARRVVVRRSAVAVIADPVDDGLAGAEDGLRQNFWGHGRRRRQWRALAAPRGSGNARAEAGRGQCAPHSGGARNDDVNAEAVTRQT